MADIWKDPTQLPLIRPIVEGTSVIFGLVAIILTFGELIYLPFIPAMAVYICGGIISALVGIRFVQYARLVWIRSDLFFNAIDVLHVEELEDKATSSDSTWLGWGFEWNAKCRQLAYVIYNKGIESFALPAPVLWAARKLKRGKEIDEWGTAWLQAIDKNRDVLFTPKQREGHTIVFGVPGSGKTRLADLIATQCIARRDVTVTIDPKGDKELAERMKAEAEKQGLPFVYLHLAHPEKSVRWQPLAQWNRPTEIPSRLSVLVPSETGSDAFTAFSWMTLASAALGSVLILHEQPTIADLKETVQWQPEDLTIRVLQRWLQQKHPNYEAEIDAVEAMGGEKRGKLTRLDKLINYYKQHGPRHSAIDGLISMAQHNKDHYGKMVATLLPLLEMLTAGHLRSLLSPDPVEDADDHRPIWDFRRAIQQNAVVYIGLDTLSDATVGSSVGSLLIAELASVAGYAYNFQDPKDMKRVSLIVDESSEVLNTPLIQMANKARGAKFEIFALAQTFSEFATKLGSESAGRMFAGEFNNKIVLRTSDEGTQKYCLDQFGKAMVNLMTRQQTTDALSFEDGEAAGFGSRIAESLQAKEAEVFPPAMLSALPNFHYLAALGGKLVKGKIPVLDGIKE